MTARGRSPSRAIVVATVAYIVFGFTTAWLARNASSISTRNAWRLGAWILSALVFLLHVAHERRRLTSPRGAALRACIAVALATLSLAISAVAHQYSAGTLRPLVFSTIAVWPLATGVVSFGVAYAVARIFRPEPSS